MAPYKIIKQGYMLKEPPPSKRGLRKVSSGARHASSATLNVCTVHWMYVCCICNGFQKLCRGAFG